MSSTCGSHANCSVVALVAADLVFRPLSEHVGESIKVEPSQPRASGLTAGDKHLPEGRFSGLGCRPDHRVVNGQVAPAEYLEALVRGQRGDGRLH